jgi:Ca2+-binding EF-hand superfamily protein
MGGSMVVPEANARMKRAVKTFLLSNSDIGKLWACFNRVDNTRIGKVSLDDIFKGYEIQNYKLLAESLMALLDIELDDVEPVCIDFADFVTIVCTFNCFEPPELLRFCMFMFDPEKNGFIEVDDLKELMNSIHGIISPDTVFGNEKRSWQVLEFPVNGHIEYEDLVEIHAKVPLMLKPVFRIQEQMCTKYMGESYWNWKKRSLYEAKLRADVLLAKKKAKKEKKANAGKEKKIKKKMGLLRYYLCPFCRNWYRDDDFGLTDDQKKDKERLMRLEQLAAKNPYTSGWKKYEKKIKTDKGGTEDYVVEKQLKTERHRDARAQGRASRRAERTHDDDLKHHPSTNN